MDDCSMGGKMSDFSSYTVIKPCSMENRTSQLLTAMLAA